MLCERNIKTNRTQWVERINTGQRPLSRGVFPRSHQEERFVIILRQLCGVSPPPQSPLPPTIQPREPLIPWRHLRQETFANIRFLLYRWVCLTAHELLRVIKTLDGSNVSDYSVGIFNEISVTLALMRVRVFGSAHRYSTRTVSLFPFHRQWKAGSYRTHTAERRTHVENESQLITYRVH